MKNPTIASCYEIRLLTRHGCPFKMCVNYNKPPMPEPCNKIPERKEQKDNGPNSNCSDQRISD